MRFFFRALIFILLLPPGQLFASFEGSRIDNDQVFIPPCDTTPVIIYTNDSLLCPGDSTVIHAPLGFSSYLWSSGQTTTSIVVKSAGVFSLVALDFNGCQHFSNQVLIQQSGYPPKPQIGFDGAMGICGSDPAKLVTNAIGTYLWMNNSTASYTSVSWIGPAWVEVANSFGCKSRSDTIYVDTLSPVVGNLIYPTTPPCEMQLVYCYVSVPVGNYSYIWENGGTGYSNWVLPVSNQTGVTVVRENGCAKTFKPNFWPQITFVTWALYSNYWEAQNPKKYYLCQGDTEFINFTKYPYTQYLWSDGDTASVNKPLTGTLNGKHYYLAISNVNYPQCNYVEEVIVFTIPDYAELTVTNDSICAGQGTVSLSITHLGNSVWSNGATNVNGITVSPTTTSYYSVTGVSTTGCTETHGVLVHVRPLPNVTVTGLDTSVCYGDSIHLEASGGVSYSWGNPLVTTATGPVFDNVYRGTIMPLKVTGLNGCIKDTLLNLGVDASARFFLNGYDSYVCGEDTLVLDPTVGSGSYLWSTGSTDTLLIVSPDTTTTYSLTFTSTTGCQFTDYNTISVYNDSIPEDTVFIDYFPNKPILLSANIYEFTYFSWSTGASTSSIIVYPTNQVEFYSLFSWNGSGCVENKIFCLRKDTLPIPTIIAPDTICNGDTIQVSVSEPGIYLWMNGDTTQSTSLIIPGGGAYYKFYYYFRRDSSSYQYMVKDTVWITAPKPITYPSVTNTICSGASVHLIANDPSSPYGFIWSNGDTTNEVTVMPVTDSVFSVVVNNNGCTKTVDFSVVVFPSADTPVVTGDTIICSGYSTMLHAASLDSLFWSTGSHNSSIIVSPAVDQLYQVFANNEYDCPSRTVNAMVYVGSPGVSYITGQDKICTGQNATLEAVGFLNVNWNTGDTSLLINVSPDVSTYYSVSGLDLNGCNQVRHFMLDVEPSPKMGHCVICSPSTYCDSGRVVTAYYYTGFDSLVWATGDVGITTYLNPTTPEWLVLNCYSGCYSEPLQDSVLIEPRGYFNARIEGDTLVCPGAIAGLNIQLSVPGHFLWSTGSTTQSIGFPVFNTITQSVTITGQNGCSETLYHTVKVVGSYSDSITGNLDICSEDSIVNLSCQEVFGASYLWSNGGIDHFTNMLCLNSDNPVQVEITFNGGCSVLLEDTVHRHVNQQSAQLTMPAQLCEGDSAMLTLSGGLFYQWSAGTTGTSPVLWVHPDTSTIYAADVFYYSADGFECSAVVMDTLVVVNKPQLEVSGWDVPVCSGSVVSLYAIGASSYSWNGVAGSDINSFVLSGDTELVVMGYNSCGQSDSVILNLELWDSSVDTVYSDTLICFGADAGVSASYPGLSYLWQDGSVDAVFNFKCIADTVFYCYEILGTGCSVTCAIHVIPRFADSVQIYGSLGVCSGGSTQLNAQGSLNYIWEGSITGTNLGVFPHNDTLITVIGSDSNGCKDTASVLVDLFPSFTLDIIGGPTLCQPNQSLFAAVNSPDSHGFYASPSNYTYLWSNGNTTKHLYSEEISTAEVTVTVSNEYGCALSVSKAVNLVKQDDIISNDSLVVCYGQPVHIAANSSPYYLNYNWGSGWGLINNYSFTANADTSIIVSVRTNIFCEMKDTVRVYVKPTVNLTVSGPVDVCDGGRCSWKATTNADVVHWYLPGSLHYIGDSISFLPQVGGAATITASAAGGCSLSITKNISLVNSSFQLKDTLNLCGGDTGYVYVNGGVSWLWSTGEVASAIAVSPVADTVYTVLVNDLNCSGTYPVYVFVEDTFHVEIFGDTATCVGEPASFYVNQGVTWQWSTGDITPSVTLPAGTPDGPLFVTAQYYNGCYGTGSLFHYSYPGVPLVISGDTLVCSGASTILSVPQGYLNYLWSNGATTSSILLSPTQTANYIVTVTEFTGCIQMDQVSVGITPQSGFAGSSAVQSLCLQNEGLIQAFLYNTQDSLQWQKSSSVNGPFTNLVDGVQFSGVHSDSLRILDVATMNGQFFRCKAYSDCFSGVAFSDTVQFNFMTSSVIVIYDSICANQSYLIGNLSHNQTGIYNDTLLSTLGCDSIVELHLFVKPELIDTQVQVNGLQVQAVPGYSNYQWFNCWTGNIIPGATTSTLTVVPNSLVYVVISDVTCIDTSNCIFVGYTGLSSLDSNQMIRIYPNPFSSGFEVLYSGKGIDQARLILFNELGQVVQSLMMKGNHISIDGSLLKSGIYFLQIEDKNRRQYFKLIKTE